jgi:hypothetical protein
MLLGLLFGVLGHIHMDIDIQSLILRMIISFVSLCLRLRNLLILFTYPLYCSLCGRYQRIRAAKQANSEGIE